MGFGRDGGADGAEGTLRAIVVLALRLPEVPATVTVDVPGAAVLAAVKVKLGPVAPGLKFALTPVGSPE